MSEINTFDQKDFDIIRSSFEKWGVLVKRSRLHTTSIVIGRPGVPGSLIIAKLNRDDAEVEEANFLLHLFPNLTPETLANSDVDFRDSDEAKGFGLFHTLLLIRKCEAKNFKEGSMDSF